MAPSAGVFEAAKRGICVKTDLAAMECIDPETPVPDRDNYVWIRDAEKNRLVSARKPAFMYQEAMETHERSPEIHEMVRNGDIGRSCSDATITTPAARISVPRNFEYQRRQ
jgi:urocanate hydratase